jgi:tetratricopeptide (TPR) repeat protein
LPVRADSSVPVTAMLSRFARGLGAARRGDTARAAQDVAALVAITADLTRRHDAYWARVADIKRQAVQAWLSLARGDTAAAIADARAAAESEDVTEKHPVTPGELLPARELLGDLLLAIGRHDEARQAYVATLEREPGRARSMFGAARAAELTGDTAAARTGYAALLKQVEWMNSDRPELLVARRGLASRN